MSAQINGTTSTLTIGNVIGDTGANGGARSIGQLTKTITDADYTLTAAEAGNGYLSIAGALSVDRNVIVPTASGVMYVVFNNATGHNLTFKTLAGTGIAVATGKRAILMVDGTNVVRITADT